MLLPLLLQLVVPSILQNVVNQRKVVSVIHWRKIACDKSAVSVLLYIVYFVGSLSQILMPVVYFEVVDCGFLICQVI